MRTVLFAYHDVGCAAIKTLIEMGEEIAAIFTHEDDLKENVWFESVKNLAESLKIPVFCPENPNSSEWTNKIKAIKPDIIFSFYYRQMICEKILAIPPKGALNLHGSLLPKYRGRAPVNWVLVNGEEKTGVTLHYMVKKPDAGDIVAQKEIRINDEDAALTLFKKLIPLTREILIETVPLLSKGNAPRIPQDHSQATYFGGRKPEDGKIDWSKSSKEIYNLIRAVTHPYPGAFTFYNGKKILIWRGKNSDQYQQESGFKEMDSGIRRNDGQLKNQSWSSIPGKIISTDPLVVSCGKGALEIDKIQTEGQEEGDGEIWAKNNSIKIGAMLK